MPRRKQRCKLGTKCPFQHEHQHTSEFSHTSSLISKKRRSTTSQKFFSGRGHKIGSGKRQSAIVKNKRDAAKTKKQRVVQKDSVKTQSATHYAALAAMKRSSMLRANKRKRIANIDSTPNSCRVKSRTKLTVASDTCSKLHPPLKKTTRAGKTHNNYEIINLVSP